MNIKTSLWDQKKSFCCSLFCFYTYTLKNVSFCDGGVGRGSFPVHWRMFNSISGLYLLDASSKQTPSNL